MRVLFSRGRNKRNPKRRKKIRQNSRRDYVCTVTAKIRWRRDGVADTTTDFPRVFKPAAGKRSEEREVRRWHDQPGMQRKARFTSGCARAQMRARARSGICSEMIPRCLIAQADIIPRAGKRDDFKQRKPPGEA